MENKKGMSTILAVVVILLLVGIFVFISIKGNNNSNEMDKVTLGRAAKAGDMVSMNYTGRLQDGTVFDSNVDPKFNHVEPFVFQLGSGQVIPGWDKGIVGMEEGQQKTLTIPPEDAYGAQGIPGVIPANATLIFEVELLKIN